MMAVAVRKTQGHVKNRRRGYAVVSANADVYLDLINDGRLMVSLTVPDYPSSWWCINVAQSLTLTEPCVPNCCADPKRSSGEGQGDGQVQRLLLCGVFRCGLTQRGLGIWWSSECVHQWSDKALVHILDGWSCVAVPSLNISVMHLCVQYAPHIHQAYEREFE